MCVLILLLQSAFLGLLYVPIASALLHVFWGSPATRSLGQAEWIFGLLCLFAALGLGLPPLVTRRARPGTIAVTLLIFLTLVVNVRAVKPYLLQAQTAPGYMVLAAFEWHAFNGSLALLPIGAALGTAAGLARGSGPGSALGLLSGLAGGWLGWRILDGMLRGAADTWSPFTRMGGSGWTRAAAWLVVLLPVAVALMATTIYAKRNEGRTLAWWWGRWNRPVARG